MEELGIGRPSTYASILQVLKDRNYVRLEKKRLYAEDKGRVVVAFLENFFARYVEYEFTAGLEEDLDRIANSEVDWRVVLRDFWRDFIGAVDNIKDLRISEVLDVLDAMLAPHLFPQSKDGTDPRVCPTCGNGRLGLKLGKFGAFIGCSNYPECKFTRQLAANGANGGGDKVLGKDPDTGLDVALKSGRFGPYLQLGEGAKKRNRSAPASRRAGRSTTSISTWRSSCSRCRAKSASIRKAASRFWPASGGSDLMCSTARPTPISTRARTCSRSASIAP
jgi:DNA topoisomerase-1